MKMKKFSDAMSELDSKYVEETLRYKKKAKRPGWIKWGAAAACLCAAIAGGVILTPKSGDAVPSPSLVQVANPIITVGSAAEMEEYLDFPVPVLDKEVASYSVFVSDGYPTMGQVDYADGSQFRIQYGSGDISGIYGGTLTGTANIDGAEVQYYDYNGTAYAIWEQDGFSFSYVYSDNGAADVETIIRLFQ